MACEPWACRNQCGDAASLMPALVAARFTIALTLRSVSLPPPSGWGIRRHCCRHPPRRERARLTISGSSTWRTLPPYPGSTAARGRREAGRQPRSRLPFRRRAGLRRRSVDNINLPHPRDVCWHLDRAPIRSGARRPLRTQGPPIRWPRPLWDMLPGRGLFFGDGW
jgi:hypothetical protein